VVEALTSDFETKLMGLFFQTVSDIRSTASKT